MGTVVAEATLSESGADLGSTQAPIRIRSRLAPVVLRPGNADIADVSSFAVTATDGSVLGRAQVTDEDLDATRRRWWRGVVALEWMLAAIGLLLMAGPLADWRAVVRTRGAYLGLSLTLAAAATASWACVERATSVVPDSIAPGMRFLGRAILAMGLTWLLATAVNRWRVASRTRRARRTGPVLRLGLQGLAAVAVGVSAARYVEIVGAAFPYGPADAARLALIPFDPGRLIGAVASIARTRHDLRRGCNVAGYRGARGRRPRWAADVVPGDRRGRRIAGRRGVDADGHGVVVAVGGCRERRHADVVGGRPKPAVAPARFAARAPRGTGRGAARAVSRDLPVTGGVVRAQPDVDNRRRGRGPSGEPTTRLCRVSFARRSTEIDATPGLADLVTASSPPTGGPVAADAAFRAWSQTSLSSRRLTSSVELYDRRGRMVSRFALNLPETSNDQTWRETACQWELFEEVSPFFAEERRLLHAGRGRVRDRRGRRAARPRRGRRACRARLRQPAVPRGAEPVCRPAARTGSRRDGGLAARRARLRRLWVESAHVVRCPAATRGRCPRRCSRASRPPGSPSGR